MSARQSRKRARLSSEDSSEDCLCQNGICFCEKDPRLHDLCVVVHEYKFYCSRYILAKHSSYFDHMLLGRNRRRKIIKLNEPEYASEFQVFLEVIHGVDSIHDGNCPGLLRLAYGWKAKVVVDRCEKFLMKESVAPRVARWRLAMKYRLEKLEKFLIVDITTIQQLKDLLPKYLSSLKKDTAVMLLQKSMELNMTKLQPCDYMSPRSTPSPEPR